MRTLDTEREEVDLTEHTTWTDLLRETDKELIEREEHGERTQKVERVLAKRVSCKGTEYEYKVRWEGVDALGDSWVSREEIGAGAMAAFAAFQRATAATTKDDADERGEEGRGEARMAYRMFDSIQDASLSRMMSDCSYSVLADALPLGKGRCHKQLRNGECDLCWIMLGKREVETTRHLGSGCPFK